MGHKGTDTWDTAHANNQTSLCVELRRCCSILWVYSVLTEGTLPYSIAMDNLFLQFFCVVLLLIPLGIVWAPASVSTACDDLLKQLNLLSFLGDDDFKQRCDFLLERMRS